MRRAEPPERNSDAPRMAWQRFPELCGLANRRVFVDSNALGKAVPLGVLDQRGVLAWSAEQLCLPRWADFSAHWVLGVLGLLHLDASTTAQALCESTARRYFAGEGNAASWVSVESCRDPITKQNKSVFETTAYSSPISWFELPPEAEEELAFVDPNSHLPPFELPHKLVRFSKGNAAVWKRPSLVRFGRIRAVPATYSIIGLSGQLAAYYDTWCLADADNDHHRDLIARLLVPAGENLRRKVIQTSRLVNFVKVDAREDMRALTFEFCPESAELLSVRHTVQQLGLFHTFHPRHDQWLCRALAVEVPDERVYQDGCLFSLEPPVGWPDPLKRACRKLLVLLTGRDGKWARERVEAFCLYYKLGSMWKAGFAIRHNTVDPTARSGRPSRGEHKGAQDPITRLQEEIRIPLFSVVSGKQRKTMITNEGRLLGQWLSLIPELAGLAAGLPDPTS